MTLKMMSIAKKTTQTIIKQKYGTAIQMPIITQFSIYNNFSRFFNKNIFFAIINDHDFKYVYLKYH